MASAARTPCEQPRILLLVTEDLLPKSLYQTLNNPSSTHLYFCLYVRLDEINSWIMRVAEYVKRFSACRYASSHKKYMHEAYLGAALRTIAKKMFRDVVLKVLWIMSSLTLRFNGPAGTCLLVAE